MRILKTVLADYPHTRALKEGELASEQFALEFVDYPTVSDAFDAMVRDQAFDVCEMAVGAYLQAKSFDKPLTLLPVVLAGGLHHRRLCYDETKGVLRPEDLKGKKVAIRAYSQTTGLWVRGILAEEYGIAPEDIQWVTLEGSHAAEYIDPPNVERAPHGTKLVDLLLEGTVDAAIIGRAGRPGLVPVIPDVEDAERRWMDRHGTTGINHMVCVRRDVAEDEAVLRGLYELLVAGIEGAGPPPSGVRFGLEHVRAALELAATFACEQKMIPVAPSFDSLFPAAIRETAAGR